MPSVRFEPTTPAGERPQSYALDRASTGTEKAKFTKENKGINIVFITCEMGGTRIWDVPFVATPHKEKFNKMQ